MTKGILYRARKLIIIIILIPFLSAGFSYFFSLGETTTQYKATSKILLGNFENEKRTNVHVMKTLLTSTGFLSKLDESFHLGLDVEKLKSSINVVSNQQENTISLEISGTDKAVVEDTLSKVTDAVMQESTQLYDSKVELLNSKIEDVKDSPSNMEPAIKHNLLYELEMTLIDIENSMVLEQTSASGSSSISTKEKVILGFLIGIIIDCFILIAPELFREAKKTAE